MESLNLIGQYLLAGINFMLVLTVLVAVHEFGHYWVAKKCGMEVEAFAVMMGGLRKTDLSSRLANPLVPARWVWLIAFAAAAITVVGGLEGWPVMHLAGLASLAVVLPVWVSLRIGVLYGFSPGQSLKFPGIGWGVGLVFLFLSTKFIGIAAGQVLTVMMFGASIALLILYYQPVLRKPEDSKMGEGELEIGGEHVPVQFRPVWSRRSKSGTEFSLLVLPLGGFAAIKGMHPKEDGSETMIANGFYSKAPFKRFLALLAGPAFSIGFGVLLYVLLFTTYGIDKPDDRPVFSQIVKASPADQAGIRPGDTIVSIDGKPTNTYFEVVSTVRVRAGQHLTFKVRRGTEEFDTTVTPKLSDSPEPVMLASGEPSGELRKQGRIGAVASTKLVKLPFGEAVSEAFAAPVRMAAGLANLIRQPGKAKDEVGGVGSIAKATYEATNEGLRVVLLLAAGLSISLGFMNLLPVPPLDGGQMVVAFVEMLRRGRRLSIQVQNRVSTVGMMLVMALVVSVLMVDMGRFLGKPDPKQREFVETKSK
ncbi:MAG: site-2 protease family protein [Fimbriimonadaceae bacterium]|nr:site-2 protease family protein [Fimbriimonadaceae bacterium]